MLHKNTNNNLAVFSAFGDVPQVLCSHITQQVPSYDKLVAMHGTKHI